MKLNVSEFAKMAGVSVRTLHYYDEIGLLKPDFTDKQTGYRFYGKSAMERMQEILFYRELDFSLKAIKEILSSPNYNRKEALKAQKQLLLLKRERLDRVIDALDCVEEEKHHMSFDVFNNSEINKYKEEVKSRWGRTDTYKEQAEKTSAYTSEDWKNVASGLDRILKGFGELKDSGAAADSVNAIAQAEKLQDFITQTQYTCTKEILASLGEMYVTDERFQKNIDKHSEGTAEYIRQAIRAYCNR